MLTRSLYMVKVILNIYNRSKSVLIGFLFSLELFPMKSFCALVISKSSYAIILAFITVKPLGELIWTDFSLVPYLDSYERNLLKK